MSPIEHLAHKTESKHKHKQQFNASVTERIEIHNFHRKYW